VEALTKPRVYLETTMFNYYFDHDRVGHEATIRLFEAIDNELSFHLLQNILELKFSEQKIPNEARCFHCLIYIG
jgi:hypothetical protein